jgi:hypothetical protein
MNGMGVETDGLPIAVIMSGECALHVLESSSVIDFASTICSVPMKD